MTNPERTSAVKAALKAADEDNPGSYVRSAVWSIRTRTTRSGQQRSELWAPNRNAERAAESLIAAFPNDAVSVENDIVMIEWKVSDE